MRRVRYSVAMSLDGYIAGPSGEFDWIVMDPEIDFAAMYGQFDTVLMGRKTFEVAMGHGQANTMPDMAVYVFSRTLKPGDHPGINVVADDAAGTVAGLRRQEGKDIWLFGGGALFGSLLEAGQVDDVEVAVVPVLLGGGIPLVSAATRRARLELTDTRTYSQSGIVSLRYAVRRDAP